MGLDMYLSVRKYVNRIDWDTTDKMESPRFTSIVNTLDMRELLEPDGATGAYVEIPVMYWRKSNAIHNWMVRELADGVDDCRPLELSTDKLRELVVLCEQVLEDHSKAGELLPTGSGFFFGTTEYDEYYYGDLMHTADRLRYIVAEAEANTIDYLVYQASW
jgi:hypothetical protein